MPHFSHQANPTRVCFGAGSLQQLPAEVDRLGGQRALVLGSPGHAAQAHEVAALLGARCAGVFAGAVMHVPLAVAQAGQAEAQRLQADLLVALGGGSTTGLAKAIALQTGLPIIAVPTSYAGSEISAIWGLTDQGLKKTGRDERVRPKTVIYDATLTLDLPLDLTLTSGFNAIAHAAEGLYAPDGNPVLALMAEEGIRASAGALPLLAAAPRDLAAREQALLGAWLCALLLDGTTMGLHHKLCHTLGGSFNLPHAATHTVLLPHALAYNAAAAPAALARIAQALGVAGDAPAALQALALRLGAPTSLRQLGLAADALDRAADLAAQTPYPNPRPLQRDALRALLQRAWDGATPAA